MKQKGGADRQYHVLLRYRRYRALASNTRERSTLSGHLARSGGTAERHWAQE